MKKSFSQWNLLQNKIARTVEKTTWVDFLFTSKYRYMELKIPHFDFLRGQVFISDIKDLFEEEIPLFFSINHLFDILYIDFLTQIKKGTDLEKMSIYLVGRKTKYFAAPTEIKQVMKQVRTNLFSFENVEEKITVSEIEKEKHAYVTLRIKDAEILRGEIFLHDLAPYLGSEHITIEELFVILYLDFITKIKSGGNHLEVMKSIVSRLN